LSELGLSPPLATVCYSPWTDLTHSSAALRTSGEFLQRCFTTGALSSAN
jgi:hypothetical protein